MTLAQANPFLALEAGRKDSLEATDRLPEAGHLWSQPEIDALILAWAARRPLLVRGEAGSGKSQIARAAAKILGSGAPLIEVIHARFEALDLLYRVDPVERLADAQIPGQLDPTNAKYVKRGPLWQAMEPEAPAVGNDYAPPVLLIDEIDKADADVPNALLDVLGNRSFTVPPLQRPPVRARDGWHPLIVITTNEERELPPAFVRRCIVLNLNPPKNPKDPRDSAPFINWLIERGRAYSPNAWGLHDMHGNVWEWVEDVWHDNYQGAPTDGTTWVDGEGDNSSRDRVFRGGSWNDYPGLLRSALRFRLVPWFRINYLGFRVARTLD